MPQDPQSAWQKAATIGASQVGERYTPTEGPQSILDLITKYAMGQERPMSVAAQDPYGIKAWQMGAGAMPQMMLGETQDVSPLAKALYSRVQKVADALPDWVHPAKALSLFKNNASKEEMDYRGLSKLLADRQGPAKMSKAEILSHLEANPVPDVRVKTLTSAAYPPDISRADATILHSIFGDTPPPVQYNRPDLNLPGGKGYTESLFTLPADTRQARINKAVEEFRKAGISLDIAGGNATYPEARFSLRKWGSGPPTALNKVSPFDLPDNLQKTWNSIMETPPPSYTSSHWQDPNVLLHTREDIRPDAQGVPGKFLQEVQSDWHQTGKEQGYVQPIDQAKLKEQLNALTSRRTELSRQIHPLQFQEQELKDNDQPYAHLARQLDPMERELDDIARQIAGLSQSPFDKGVPDAPFKESWPDLALKKHVLDVANSPDQNWLGFTTGDTQNARYNLIQHANELAYNPRSKVLNVVDKNGNLVGQPISMEPNELPAFIGRETADKLLSTPLAKQYEGGDAWHKLVGEDLQVGGTGMKHFYDNVLPSRLNKILKPFGGSVEQGAVAIPPNRVVTTMIGDSAKDQATNDIIASVYPRNASGRIGPNGYVPASVDLADTINKQRAANPPTSPAWLAKITPEMKQAILAKGLPLLTTIMMLRQAAGQPVASHPQGTQ